MVTKGCTLRSKRGATAKVISVETKQGSKDRKPFALNVIIKEGGKERSAKLPPSLRPAGHRGRPPNRLKPRKLPRICWLKPPRSPLLQKMK